jgi:hypothetical protein
LEAKEKEWRLKRKDLWLQSGDENTKLFQAYAKGRKMVNTIWSLKDSNGRSISSFEGLLDWGLGISRTYSKQMEELHLMP